MRVAFLVFAGLLAAMPALGQAVPSPAEALSLLRGGGLVLYMRHPATEPGQADAEALDFAAALPSET
ncbi:hypothetical protein ACFQX4_18100 [Roseomonas sp. GCM10028921]